MPRQIVQPPTYVHRPTLGLNGLTLVPGSGSLASNISARRLARAQERQETPKGDESADDGAAAAEKAAAEKAAERAAARTVEVPNSDPAKPPLVCTDATESEAAVQKLSKTRFLMPEERLLPYRTTEGHISLPLLQRSGALVSSGAVSPPQDVVARLHKWLQWATRTLAVVGGAATSAAKEQEEKAPRPKRKHMGGQGDARHQETKARALQPLLDGQTTTAQAYITR